MKIKQEFRAEIKLQGDDAIFTCDSTRDELRIEFCGQSKAALIDVLTQVKEQVSAAIDELESNS